MLFGCLDSFKHWVVRCTKSSVMSTSKLRAVDMAVLNLFDWAKRITIADGVERRPENACEISMELWRGGGGLPGPIINDGSAFVSSNWADRSV